MGMFNKKMIYFFCLFFYSYVHSLGREYESLEFCIEHQKKTVSSRCEELIPYLGLIPYQDIKSSNCNYISCLGCKTTPWLNTSTSEDCWECCCSRNPKKYPPFDYGVNPKVKFPIVRGSNSIYIKNGWHTNWRDCHRHPIYSGYLYGYEDFFSFYQFKKYLIYYVAFNPHCTCFWPEKSDLAATISDKAYLLFKNLLDKSNLCILYSDSEEQARFFLNSMQSTTSDIFPSKNKNVVVIFLIRHCFFYSDYNELCDRLEVYSREHFTASQYSMVSQKLNNIKSDLKLLFAKLYDECLAEHPSEFIQREKFLVDHWNDYPG